jgi:Zn-dependent protease with chaperone function
MSAVWASLRALLAIVLLAGLVILFGGVGLFAVVALIVLFPFAAHDAGSALAFRGALFVLAVVPLLLGIGQGLRAITRSAPLRPDAVPVSREDSPMLWELATGVAWQVGARPPDVLLLTGDANASVSEDGAALGLLSGQRRLYLGLPLLAALTHAELRALLAHEFGHFSNRHTRFGAMAYRCDAALSTTIDQWRYGPRWYSIPHLVLRGSLRLYGLVFHWLTFAVRRQQELEADRTAARLAGREVTADALRAAHGVGAAWQKFKRDWLDPAALAGMHPDNPYLAFRSLLGELGVRRMPVHDGGTRVRRRDSHPPLGLRLRRLASLDGPPGEDDGTGALRLLPENTGRVLKKLRGRPADSMTTIAWERWIELAAGRTAGTRAWVLLRATARATGRGNVGLDTVLRLLAEGGLVLLAREFDGADDELTEALYALVGHTLVRAGRASWRPTWGGGTRLECEGLAEDGLLDMVAKALAQPPDLDRLRLHLRLLDVDPDRSGPPDPEDPWTTPDTSPQDLQFVPLVDSEAATEEKRRGYTAIGLAGVALLISLAAAFVGRDNTTTPPSGNRCTVGSSGALSCGPTYLQPTYAQPTYLQPTYNWLGNMPSLRPTGLPSRLLPTPPIVLPSDLLRDLDIVPAPSR